ncbi:serine/threonine protein kinase [Calothrix sp. NIES-4071]|nr:serine/threonine protein kinase [Calothrix sp. NIES-4071]BAZ63222.1 serine/threonine protein kinase [Calothrix sp. NIES-4105]
MNLCINPNCDKQDNSNTNRFCANCGSELLLAGRYRVVNLLDYYTNGNTYEVREVGNDTLKVLQVLTVDKAEVVESFEKTAAALKAINNSGIPKVEANDYFIYFPRDKAIRLHCLVMEKIEGLNLYKYLEHQAGKNISEQQAVKWLQQVITILQEIHTYNVLHSRINPSNLILKPDDLNLALIGFGQPYISSEDAIYKPAIAYTPSEQFHGKLFPQSDIFAVARVFAFLVTGKDPSKFLDLYETSLNDSNEISWRKYASHISPKLLDLLDKMMTLAPMQRPNTQEILNVLTPHQTAPYIELPNSIKPSFPKKWGKFEFNFLLSWILATITGVMIGGLIGFIIGFAAEFMVGAITKSVTIGYISGGAIFGLITGILVGAAQSLVLHQHDYKFKWWMLVTILGFTIEGILSVLTGYGAKGEMLIIPSIAVGLFQWLVLRQHVRRAYWWVLASSSGGVIGIAIYKGVQYFLGNAYSIFGGILGLVGFGLITGICILMWRKIPT